MKIAIDCRMLEMSGIGVYLRCILMQFKSVGLSANFLVAAESGEGLAIEEALAMRCDAKVYSLREQIECAWLLHDADRAWVPHYNAPLLRWRELVVTIHDCAHLDLPDVFNRPGMRAYAWLTLAAVCASARDIICVSHFSADRLRHWFPWAKGKISVIHNGAREIQVDSTGAAGAPSMARRRPYFLCVGNLKPHKNVRRLMLEFLETISAHDCDLVVVGQVDGLRTKVEEEVIGLARASGRVRILGKISDAELRQLYQGAKAVVLPSRYEGFGLPLVEAMRLGCPVLASRIPAFVEICRGWTGQSRPMIEFFDLEIPGSIGEAMLKFLHFPSEEISRRIKIGSEAGAHFSWEAAARRTANVVFRRDWVVI